MKIRDIVSSLNQVDTHCCEPNVSLLAVTQILSHNNIGAVPVVDDNDAVVGIISERDVVRYIANHQEEFFDSTVESAMTSKVITCSPDDQAADVYKTLMDANIRHIPVLEDEELSVVLSIRDFDLGHGRTAVAGL